MRGVSFWKKNKGGGSKGKSENYLLREERRLLIYFLSNFLSNNNDIKRYINLSFFCLILSFFCPILTKEKSHKNSQKTTPLTMTFFTKLLQNFTKLSIKTQKKTAILRKYVYFFPLYKGKMGKILKSKKSERGSPKGFQKLRGKVLRYELCLSNIDKHFSNYALFSLTLWVF